MSARQKSRQRLAGMRGTATTLGLALTFVIAPVFMVFSGQAHAADKEHKKPKTKVTQVLSQAVYKKMEKAEDKFGKKDYKGAEGVLDDIHDGYDHLNDYEKATLWNLYAAVYRSEDNNKKAVQAYFNLLKQKNLPEGLRNDALFSLAQTYFLEEDYNNAIRVLNKWLTVVDTPQPDAYILIAQAYYQMNQYQASIKPILQALQIAKKDNKPFKENWLSLLRAAYYETKQYPQAAKVLQLLVIQHPEKGTYWLQLSGMYGLLGNQKLQAIYMHIAYVNGLITSPSDLLNVARLYLAQNAPQRAVDLIIKEMRAKVVKVDAKNLQLLAQAMSLARDTKESVPVLIRLAQMTGESQNYIYLGQAYTELSDWDKAADAYRSALKASDAKNPGDIRMQLGTALYNGDKLQAAKEAFQAASSSPDVANSASNWVQFVNTELQRRHEMGG